MRRKLRVKVAFLIFLIAMAAGQIYAQKVSSDGRRQTVRKFFSVWLARKDSETAIKFFHPKAFLSEDIIDDIGYLSEAKETDPLAIRQRVIQFLSDSSVPVKGKTLKDILFLNSTDNPEASKKIASLLRKRSFNRPSQDKYYLVEFKSLPKELRSGYQELFKNRFALSDSFITFIQYRLVNTNEKYGDDVFMIILWVKYGHRWRIIQIGNIDNDST